MKWTLPGRGKTKSQATLLAETWAGSKQGKKLMTDEEVVLFWKLIDQFNLGLPVKAEDRLFLKRHIKDFAVALRPARKLSKEGAI